MRYANLIDGKYVIRLKNIPEPPAIANIAETKQIAKPADIKFWHSCMSHLSYRSLKMLKDVSIRIELKKTTPKKLSRDCEKVSQIRQSVKILISQSIKFLYCIYSDLDGLFPQTRQGYRYYISFLEENIGLIYVKPLKYKDDTLAAFKNYKALGEKQSSCQLKVRYIDGRG